MIISPQAQSIHPKAEKGKAKGKEKEARKEEKATEAKVMEKERRRAVEKAKTTIVGPG